ncbi:TlpA family protein disulfide reductase [Pseudofulvibacter geojedonensis]|uniref:TlpA family protein disulfide reductase n=1 Tax=Pseudofulvibacter geojedonensis TaxID=1123758 RepID=A0ABW3I020_9FLAO
MKNILKKVLVIVFIAMVSCSNTEPKENFPKEALADTLLALDGTKTTLENVLNKYKGKTIVIDIWASWCGDCIKGLPLVNALQQQTKDSETVYVFLSLDKKQANWKNAIEKRKIEGDHYFIPSGWEGPIGKSVDLDWIPRYMVVGKDGKIKLYKAVKANDKKILETVKSDQ